MRIILFGDGGTQRIRIPLGPRNGILTTPGTEWSRVRRNEWRESIHHRGRSFANTPRAYVVIGCRSVPLARRAARVCSTFPSPPPPHNLPCGAPPAVWCPWSYRLTPFSGCTERCGAAATPRSPCSGSRPALWLRVVDCKGDGRRRLDSNSAAPHQGLVVAPQRRRRHGGPTVPLPPPLRGVCGSGASATTCAAGRQVRRRFSPPPLHRERRSPVTQRRRRTGAVSLASAAQRLSPTR